MSNPTSPATSDGKPQTWLGAMWQHISAVFSHDVWPFVAGLFHTIELDVVHALAPYAEQAVAEIANELPLLMTQGTEGFLKAFNKTMASTLQKAEGAGITVATSALTTAVGAALHNATGGVSSGVVPTGG